MKHLFYLFVVIFLLLTGCSLPKAPTPAEKTASAEETVAAMVETIQAAQPTDTPTPSPSATATVTNTPAATFTLTPTFGPTPTPTLGPDYFHGSLWYEAEFVSQEGLRYNGMLISTGCTAASVQMVLDFWHAYNEAYPTMSAQTLIDQNVWQRRFDPATGLNIMDTEDDLTALNYYLGVRQDSDKEELIAALERYGPLLVLTKVNWNPFGANHMAVVTGYDPDEDLIRVLDPWQLGGIMEFPYENFDGIWSLNYLDDATETLQRTFFFIVPYAELDPVSSPFVPYSVLSALESILSSTETPIR